MLIGDNYKLEADTMNLILYKKVTPEQLQEEALIDLANAEEPGTEEHEEIIDTAEPGVKWKLLGYFGTAEGVFNFLINNELIEKINLGSLEQIVSGQRELSVLILSLDFESITLKSLRAKDNLSLPDEIQPATTDAVIEEDTQEQQRES